MREDTREHMGEAKNGPDRRLASVLLLLLNFVITFGHAINLNLFVCKRQVLSPCGDWI